MLFVSEIIQIPENELEFSYARSSGPGGQNVNKVNSKALLRWNPAKSRALPEAVLGRFLARYQGQLTKEGDLLLVSERFRDRLQNQEDCLQKLRDLVLAVLHPPKVRKKTRPSRSSVRKRQEKKRLHGEKKKNRSGKACYD